MLNPTHLTILLCVIGQAVVSQPSKDSSPAPVPIEYRLTRVSRVFDFLVRMQAHIPDGLEDYREGPANVLVFRKGAPMPIQTIDLENIFVSFDEKGSPRTNSARLYDDQGLINVGDFNFDSHEDFAIQTGNSGSYGSPSYSIYLYDPTQSKFQFSAPLSDLIEETLGFFHVDASHKRLITLAKSGCCYHETVTYKVENNRPIPVSRIVDDASDESGYEYVSHEWYRNGKWSGTTKRLRLPPSDRPPLSNR